MDFIEYPDREMLFLALAGQITGELGQQLRSGQSASIALPGGTTPGPLFDLMADVELDWAQVTVLPTDERWVPESDARSNGAFLRRRLLKGAAAGANFLPLYAPFATPEEALDDVTAALVPHLPLSCAVVGMGEDGHIAGLFPDSAALSEGLSPQAPPLVALRSDTAIEPRLSLSLPVLRQAIHLHVIILGEAKKRTLESARSRAVELAPIAAILDNAKIHWAE